MDDYMNNRDHLKPEVRPYLNRIEYAGQIDANAVTLASLQDCHLHTVPYENLDILRGVPLSLEIQHLFDKIVVKERGGFCFELNALFGWLLKELGYKVTNLVARFWRDESNTPPKQRHQVLMVEVGDDEYYLCDVGVGGIVPRRPIKMVEGIAQQQGEECYRLERNSEYGWVLCELHHGEWRWIYSFTEEPKLPKDFIMPTYWCENAPDSIFTKDAMIAIRTREGRNTVAGKEFRIFTSDGVQSFSPQTDQEYKEALYKYFGIPVN